MTLRGLLSGVEPSRFRNIAATTAIALVLLGGCATQVRFPSASQTRPVMLSAVVSRPEGAGRFPAMILLHTCGGLSSHELTWALWLNSRGYVTVAVDSFSPRGLSNACGGNHPGHGEVRQDALGALTYLRSLPYVDADRVGVIGWSGGGTTALLIAENGSNPRTSGIRAAIAFYPYCNLSEPTIPVLMLLGEKDDWTPPGWCVSQAEWLKSQGRTEVELKLYPGITHGFDNARHKGGVNYLGHFMRYDGAATSDAEQRLEAFLRRYVSTPKSTLQGVIESRSAADHDENASRKPSIHKIVAFSNQPTRVQFVSDFRDCHLLPSCVSRQPTNDRTLGRLRSSLDAVFDNGPPPRDPSHLI